MYSEAANDEAKLHELFYRLDRLRRHFDSDGNEHDVFFTHPLQRLALEINVHLESRCNAVSQRIRLLQRLRHGDDSVTEEQRRDVLFANLLNLD